MDRLATHLWVAAYRARLEIEGVYSHIVHRGDATAGAVMVKVATMDGQSVLWERGWDEHGGPAWVSATASIAEADADAQIARARSRDRDLWVIEVEDPRGRHFLDDPSLT
ncbi:MAG: DUF1491 family protein [Pseudomonadota bacterium]